MSPPPPRTPLTRPHSDDPMRDPAETRGAGGRAGWGVAPVGGEHDGHRVEAAALASTATRATGDAPGGSPGPAGRRHRWGASHQGCGAADHPKEAAPRGQFAREPRWPSSTTAAINSEEEFVAPITLPAEGCAAPSAFHARAGRPLTNRPPQRHLPGARPPQGAAGFAVPCPTPVQLSPVPLAVRPVRWSASGCPIRELDMGCRWGTIENLRLAQGGKPAEPHDEVVSRGEESTRPR
jgi:hypothetical protein